MTSMDPWTYYAITHRDHRLLNPLSEQKIDQLLAVLRLSEGTRLLDIACGKGELLLRAAAAQDLRAIGVDISPPFVHELRTEVAHRGLGARIEVIEGDGSAYDTAPEAFDVALCIGASWIWKGLRGTLRALSRWARPGGIVVAGEPHWLRDPSPEYLAAEGLHRASFASHEANVQIGIEEGLVPLYAMAGNVDEWDRYEALQWQAAERWAEENPDHPELDYVLGRVRKARVTYLRWGRDTCGFGLYVFRTPK